jgi:EAL and modified HD-GYP domain-containing signal transduction protein
LVRRQPIFDGHERLAGYELLIASRAAAPTDATAAGLIAATCAEVGLRRVVGDHRAYITATRDLVALARELRLPAEQVVLQLPKQPVDELLLASVHRVVEGGFGVGVGGWALEPGAETLLALTTTVKVDFDFGTLDLNRLLARRDELRARAVTLIADHVGTHGEYEECRRLGFDAFQGEFLAQPTGLAARRTPTARMASLAGVLRATGPRAFEELEQIISQDAGLAHRFLRLADCALYARRARARSVRDALARLGALAVRRWALMLLLARLSDTSSSTARHLLGLGLHRARTCELLARQDARAYADVAFTAGLLSVLPALIDQPMNELLANLPIDDRLVGALVHHAGPEGRLLAATIAYEHGERENADDLPPLLAAITGLYSESLLWADNTAAQLI